MLVLVLDVGLVLVLVLVVAGSAIEVAVWVGTVGRLTVRGKFRVRLMVMIGRTVMHVGAVGRLIVLGMLIVRGRLPRLWVLLLAGMWRLEQARV